MEFIYSVLWKLPEKDLLIIKQDYEIIHNKIVNGLAHTLSEGDTMYLGACRKGQKGDKAAKQYNSDILAPRRAFCLKMSYMRTILAYVQKSGKNAMSNYKLPKENEAVSADALKSKTFDNIIIDRFRPYFGIDELAIARMINIKLPNSKSKYFILANRIANAENGSNINKSEEFRKAGLMMKTIRVQANGIIEQAMSFENINYQEVYDNDEWLDSRLYEIFTSRFLFVIFRERTPKAGDYVLDKVFFWTMPQEDLATAEEYWNNIRSCVLQNKIDTKYFWKISDDRYFHVRPKGTKAEILTDNPNGGKCKKYCYWFNNDYISKIVNSHA